MWQVAHVESEDLLLKPQYQGPPSSYTRASTCGHGCSSSWDRDGRIMGRGHGVGQGIVRGYRPASFPAAAGHTRPGHHTHIPQAVSQILSLPHATGRGQALFSYPWVPLPMSETESFCYEVPYETLQRPH